jgi:hypothetical protein
MVGGISGVSCVIEEQLMENPNVKIMRLKIQTPFTHGFINFIPQSFPSGQISNPKKSLVGL